MSELSEDVKSLGRSRFCILTTQRSGSAWLVNLLDSHPQLIALYELFLDRRGDNQNFLNFSELKLGSRRRRPGVTGEYLTALEHYPVESSCIGFKLMYSQLYKYPELFFYLALRRFQVIHFVREKFLDVAFIHDR